MNAGCAGKTVRSLENVIIIIHEFHRNISLETKLRAAMAMCGIPEHLRGVFTTRRYTNQRLPYLYLPVVLCKDAKRQVQK